MTIALLGATGHIAKNLIYYVLCENTDPTLYLFARNTEAVKKFIVKQCKKPQKNTVYIKPFDEFPHFVYDALINCVGVSNTKMQKKTDFEIFAVTEHYDNLCIDYLAEHSKCKYINFSSGAVYGTGFASAVTQETKTEIAVNAIGSSDYYRLAKLYAEAKHRALCAYSIVDIRIFSFFSRFIDFESSFLITEMITCVKQKVAFITNDQDITRDYTHPSDLFALVTEILQKKEQVNTAIDLRSTNPITKFRLIDFFQKKYNMQVQKTNQAIVSATGLKSVYYSKCTSPCFAWQPTYSSLEAIEMEMRQDKTRQDKTRQDKTRQDIILCPNFFVSRFTEWDVAA